MVFNIQRMVKFWTGKTNRYDKGGSFNLELYLRICEIKMNQQL
jgi:hypothetical protein